MAIVEVINGSDQILLHVFIEDNIAPFGLLDTIPQLMVLLPVALIKNEHRSVNTVGKTSSLEQELLGCVDGGRQDVLVADDRIRALAVTTLCNVDDILLTVPVDQELAKFDTIN